MSTDWDLSRNKCEFYYWLATKQIIKNPNGVRHTKAVEYTALRKNTP